MNEKVYKTMTGAGAGNIAVGIVVLVTGIVCQGRVIIDDTLKSSIDAYYEQYGAK